MDTIEVVGGDLPRHPLRIDVVDRRGERKTVGDFALHLQCPWRLVRCDGGKVARSGTAAPEATARIDALLGACGFVVRDALGDQGGTFTLDLDACRLEVSPPPGRRPGEAWRLFRPYADAPHAVVGGDGRLTWE